MIEFKRREVIFGAASAFAAFGVARPITFITPAAAQSAAPGFKRYQVGDIEVISLFDGVWEKPHDEKFIRNASIDETKAALNAAGLPDAFVPVPFTTTAVRTGGQTILIDTGTGGGQTGGPKAGLLAQSMTAAGIDPKSVKKILLSHFHGDHIFGLMSKENTQQFPDAEIIVPAAEFAWWTQPIEQIPEGRRGNAQRVQATLATWKNVTQVDGEKDVAPGIRTLPAFGHTQGHTAYHVSSGNKQFIVSSDATNIAALFVKNPEWQSAFDHVPELAIETRKKLFDRVIADGVMVSGYHWGLPNAGTLVKDGKGYTFNPAG